MQKTRIFPRHAGAQDPASASPHGHLANDGHLAKVAKRGWSVLGWLAFLGAIGVLFGSVLSGADRLAFRDVGHFYQPLYEYLTQRAVAGGLPLWNPLDHSGIPVLGETTTAMFYPLRWLFLLPWPTSVAMGVYISVHLAIAAFGTYWSAKRASCSSPAAYFAAIAYTFSCPILFLHTNPPFLVGAAWLPWMLTAGVALMEKSTASRGRQRYRTVVLSGYLFALPVLGGDPQTAVHVGILLGIIFAGKTARYALDTRRNRHCSSPKILPLFLAIVFAIGIALPQIAASLDWAVHSARRHGDQADVYAFSVAPWHWLDLWVPYANGQLFPQYQRISHLIPSDMQVWSVSLYCGISTIFLCLWRYVDLLRGTTAALFRRPTTVIASDRPPGPSPPRWTWWDILLPVGVSMTAGHFGGGWWLQQIAEPPLSPPAFGPYWMLVEWFPGYDAFRYPAKWLPIAVLGIAITSGIRLSHVAGPSATHPSLGRRSWQIGLAVAGGLLLIGSVVHFPAIQRSLLASLPDHKLVDNYWGPLNLEQSIANWSYSFLHAGSVLAVASLAVLCLAFSRKKRAGWGAGIAAGVLLVDLMLINSPLVALVDRGQVVDWKGNPSLTIASPEFQSRNAAAAALRTGAFAPAVWSEGSGRGRIAEVAASEELGIQGRWHLTQGLRVWNSATSITPDRHQSFSIAAQNAANRLGTNDRAAFWHSLAKHWNLSGYLHTSSDSIPVMFQDDTQARLLKNSWIPIDSSPPAVYWSPTFQVSEVQGRLNHQNWQPLFDAVHAPSNVPAWQPLVEIPGGAIAQGEQTPASLPPLEVPNLTGAKHALTVQSDTAQRLAVSLTTSESGLLVRSTFQDGNWHARYRPQAATPDSGAWKTMVVYPVDYLHQGVLLPRGAWEIEIWYFPWWLLPSTGISILLLLGSFVILKRQPEQ